MPKTPKDIPPVQHSGVDPSVTLDDISAAAAAIAGSVIVTECDRSRTLGEICGTLRDEWGAYTEPARF